MCDGTPPDFHLAVREFLNELSPEKWIGRSGLTAWPALSPDLNSLLFILGDIYPMFMFMSQKSATSGMCNYEYKMDLK
jgi:hypothetical protein